MARELVEKDIDGHRYEFEQFGTTVALRTLSQLTKLLGEPIMIGVGAVFKAKQKAPKGKSKDGAPAPAPKGLLDVDTSEMDGDLLVKAVRTLVDRMDEDEVVTLVKRLTTEGILCDNAPIKVFDDHYCGRLDHLFAVLRTQLAVQYGNFIDAISAKMQPVRGKAPAVAGIRPV